MPALVLLLLFSINVFANGPLQSSASKSLDPSILPQPEESLKNRIQFWVKIYSELSTSEGVIHDAKYPEIVYEKVDFREESHNVAQSAASREKNIKAKINRLKDFYTKILLNIHKKQNNPEQLTAAEKRVFELFIPIKEPAKFYNAAHGKRVRFQLGQKDRFAQGLYYSGKYLPFMERIFKQKGLPPEISRLPFVESSFNLNARSKVGASGIWQFMRSTGKLFLSITDVIDERNDPIRATEAAAELLKANYQALGSWPLAITAYNHGRKGMMRALTRLGTDSLFEIIENYRSRSFGFASSNFYAELMAAIEVEKNADKYFGKIERDKPIEFSEIVLTDFIDLQDLSTYTRIPQETLLEYNPGFTENVIRKKYFVPSGYSFRVPSAMRESFLNHYSQIPPSKKYSAQKGSVLGKIFRK